MKNGVKIKNNISGLMGLKNDRFRIFVPFLATVLILVSVGALLGWFS